jgi:hypothetical protein
LALAFALYHYLHQSSLLQLQGDQSPASAVNVANLGSIISSDSPVYNLGATGVIRLANLQDVVSPPTAGEFLNHLMTQNYNALNTVFQRGAADIIAKASGSVTACLTILHPIVRTAAYPQLQSALTTMSAQLIGINETQSLP